MPFEGSKTRNGLERSKAIYGFVGLGLHNVMLMADSFNEHGLRAYAGAGSKEIGRCRQATWIAGKPYNAVYMDCLATEFASRVMQRYLPKRWLASKRRRNSKMPCKVIEEGRVARVESFYD